MTKPSVLTLALILLPATANADSSRVEVTLHFEMYPASCATSYVGTFSGFHDGTITAIGFEDRNKDWSLSGQIGSCQPFGPNNPTSESIVKGKVEATPYLQTSTQFDMICKTIEEKTWFGRTRAFGPWQFGVNTHLEDTGCMDFQCS